MLVKGAVENFWHAPWLTIRPSCCSIVECRRITDQGSTTELAIQACCPELECEYVEEGRSMADIGRQFGISAAAINQWLNKFNIATRGRPGR